MSSPATSAQSAARSLHADEQHAAALCRVVNFFECISPASVAQLAQIYSADARFKDPFNEVQGIAAITAIFSHMFVQVKQPRFVITEQLLRGDQAFLCWEFWFGLPYRSLEYCIRGATHFRFTEDGRVCLHRDYWDAAEELYEQLPVLGSLMRGLKKLARR